MAARCAHVNRCTERRQLERVASFRKRAAQRARQRARQFAQLYLVHRSSLRRTSNHESCILREMRAYIDLRCILSRIIYKLRYKDIVGNYRSREYSEEKVRYVTSFHRITERGSAFRIKRNLHGASRVVAFATSCHALSSLSSRLIPIGSLQRENRLATISGDLLLFRLVSTLCPLSRYVFPCLATQKVRPAEKFARLPPWISRSPTTRACVRWKARDWSIVSTIVVAVRNVERHSVGVKL